MKCQILFFGKNKKNITDLLSAELEYSDIEKKTNVSQKPIITMVNVLKLSTPKLPTKWHMQTVQTQIRLFLRAV